MKSPGGGLVALVSEAWERAWVWASVEEEELSGDLIHSMTVVPVAVLELDMDVYSPLLDFRSVL